MAGFGGFGGFGQNNNNTNQQSTFGSGAFGQTNTPSTGGFGQQANTTSPFGSNNTTGGGLFGGSTPAASGFGSGGTGGAFGSAFGAKTTTPAFGANTANTGSNAFGSGGGTSFGFGANNASPAFGASASNNTGSLFGGSKPAVSGFGGGSTSSPFGNTSTSFGATGGSTAFGASTATAKECPGTGITPYQATVEDEPTPTNRMAKNTFQSVCFQPAYKDFSYEELRLVDYQQGRRHGNSNQQAGAFGASTNFGGFGSTSNTTAGAFGTPANQSTGSGLFGNTNNSTFGQQPAANAFGNNNNNSGGLFGQKPAATGFGATSTPSNSNLFGGSNSSTGNAFGNTNNNAFGTPNTGGLFGNTNNDNKPATGGFGGGFGAQSTPAATGFGSSNVGSLFGNTAQSNNSAGTNNATPSTNLFGTGGFGSTNNQQQANTTSSLFGVPKPAGGLFGTPASSTPGGLFGNTPTPATTGFGTPAGNTGLFGGTKPAPASNLFGAPNTTQIPSSNLFGGLNQNNQQQQQQQAPSLFGGTPQKQSVFGGTSQGSSLFGNPNNANSASTFDQNNNQQQQQAPQASSSLFGGGNSFLGNSQQGSQPHSLTASLNDPAAFGASIFQSLGAPNAQNPGPVATPLSSASKSRKPTQMPIYRLNPAASSPRFNTPTKRGGFGFSYSTSSGATSSSSTPLSFSQSLLGNGLNQSLSIISKSASTNNMRSHYNGGDSILAPNAFSVSTNSRPFGSNSGSVKKLVINKSLRNELFTPPKESKDSGKKAVHFKDASHGLNPSPLKTVQSSSSTPSSQELGFLRSSTNGTPSSEPASEMQQATGDEVSVIEETSTPAAPPKQQQQGDYWCNPSIEELKKMNHQQLKKVSNFTAGRIGAGKVRFDRPVNLGDPIKLDELLDGVIIFQNKNCTVYPDPSKKPPPGIGLNVPSTIMLEQCFPGDKTSKVKFLRKLKSMPETTFQSWDETTGIWTFIVEHYTTYGLGSDEEADDEDEEETVENTNDFGESTLSAPPDTPTPTRQTPREEYQEESYMTTTETNTDSHIDDTFEFRTQKRLPGAFHNGHVYEEEVEDAEMDDEYLNQDQSFLDNRSVGSQSDDGVEDSRMEGTIYDDESIVAEEQEVASSSFSDDITTERGSFHVPSYDADMKLIVPDDTPALMRERLREKTTPSKSTITAGDDWMKSLQSSISPRKQDRNLLKQRLIRELEDINDEDEGETPTTKRITTDGAGIATSIDLMNSLFGQVKSPQKPIRSPKKTPQKPRGFARPYSKVRTAADEGNMDEKDQAFHASFKPSWGHNGVLIYAAQPDFNAFGRSGRATREKDGLLEIQGIFNVSDSRDIRFAKFSYEDYSIKSIQKQKSVTTISSTESGIPYAQIVESFRYTDFSQNITVRNPAAVQEKLVWELASALFENIKIPEDLKSIPDIDHRLRKERVSEFWQKLVDGSSTRNAALAKTSEEKAIACLSGHKIMEACNHLLTGENFHLATLVALLGNRSEAMRKDIKDQLKVWDTKLLLSEIDAPIRAIYEVLSGNVCACSGKEIGPREDCFKPFRISTKFGLDWRQAFGMRLWYAISVTSPLQEAINLFEEDLSQDRESEKPAPWYVEQGLPELWSDTQRNDREDLLWGLLKLFANPDTEDLQSILRPENSQLSPLDVRLSWQLGQTLIAHGRFNYGSDSDDKEDTLTLSFANQLTTQGDWLDATFVLLHLINDEVRAKAIKEHISRHAGKIGEEIDAEFQTLTKEFKVPPSWVWEAKALYMRSVNKNPRREVECLLKAGSWDQAHDVFSSEVAPTAIIERDYDVLKKLLRGFKGRETRIEGWHLGGELYSNYVSLVEGQKSNPGHVDAKIIERLLAALPAVADQQQASTMETIAIQEIGGVVAKIALGSQTLKKERKKILRLPLTEDKCLQHTVDLALDYYRSVVAFAK